MDQMPTGSEEQVTLFRFKHGFGQLVAGFDLAQIAQTFITIWLFTDNAKVSFLLLRRLQLLVLLLMHDFDLLVFHLL